MRRKKHTEKEVHADLISVVSVRLREGYTIRDISLTKGAASSPLLQVVEELVPRLPLKVEVLIRWVHCE